MVFQATQNNPTELEELSVERDVEADGYVVGFEDTGGSFVEVGGLENLADDVTQPLEIKHQNSGERITLDSSGLTTQKIDGNRLYAGAFPGADADVRLDNALSEAADGNTILLENNQYTADITTSLELSIIGAGARFSGSSVAGSTTWTFDSPVVIDKVGFENNATALTLNGKDSFLTRCNFSGSAAITLSSIRCVVNSITGGQITLTSNSADCLINSTTGAQITDNGSRNTIGDIA
jgi:hypothetical protein